MHKDIKMKMKVVMSSGMSVFKIRRRGQKSRIFFKRLDL